MRFDIPAGRISFSGSGIRLVVFASAASSGLSVPALRSKFIEKQNQYDLDRLVIRPLRSLSRGVKVSGWEEDAEPEPAQVAV